MVDRFLLYHSMGRRVHLFAVQNQTELEQLISLINIHNAWVERAIKMMRDGDYDAHLPILEWDDLYDLDDIASSDCILNFNCVIMYQNQYYMEYIAYTTCPKSESLFSRKLGCRYFPPFEKPIWFHGNDVKVMECNTIPTAFDDLLKLLPKN